MPITLTQATRRESSRSRRTGSAPLSVAALDPYRLDGPALAREVAAALRTWTRARALSDTERESLAQMVAERLTRADHARRHGSAREVLRYIDRCERFPLLARRADYIARGDTGREHIRQIAGGLMRDSREWRDLAESYRTRAERDDTEAMIPPRIERMDTDALAEAAERDRARSVEAGTLREIALDRTDLAYALADAVAADALLTEAEGRRIALALCADLLAVPLASLAVRSGKSLLAVTKDASRGRKLLTEAYPDPRELLPIMRDVAEREGFTLRASDAPDLRTERDPTGSMARAAALLIERSGLGSVPAPYPLKVTEREPRITDGIERPCYPPRGGRLAVLAYIERCQDRIG